MVTKNAREKPLEANLAEFAKMKDNGDLRGAYKQLKVTLRSLTSPGLRGDGRASEPRNRISADTIVNSLRPDQLQGMTASR